MLEEFRKKIEDAKNRKEYNYSMFIQDYLPNHIYATIMNQVSGRATLQEPVKEAIEKYLAE